MKQASDSATLSHSETNLRHAWALVRTLAAADLAGAVVSPGSRSTPLVLALHHYYYGTSNHTTTTTTTTPPARPPLAVDAALNGSADHPVDAAAPLYVVLDERAAAFTALGLARATGRPALLVCTSGSAAAHYLPALVEASEAGLALILLTADRPRELHHASAAQTTDQANLFGSAVLRHAQQLAEPCAATDPRSWAAAAVTALGQAQQHSGPVQINCPFREPLYMPQDRSLAELLSATTESTEPAPAYVPATGSQPNAAACAELAQQFLTAHKRGVLVVGPQVPPEDVATAAAALALARKLEWPVLADALSAVRRAVHLGERDHNGNGHHADDNAAALVVTHADVFLRNEAVLNELAADTDVVLQLGRPPTSKRLTRWLATAASGATLLQLGDEPGRTRPDPQHLVQHHFAGSPACVAEVLLHHVDALQQAGDEQRDRQWLKRWQAAEASVAERLAAVADAPDAALTETTLARRLVATLPPRAILHVASSMPVRDVNAHAAAPRHPLTVTANRGVNGIDGTVATALGLALAADADTPVFALLGDLATWHDLDGLHTAAQLTRMHQRTLTLVVADNEGGHIFDHLAIAEHPDEQAYKRYFLTPQQGDLRATAAALGATSVTRISTLTALETALATTQATPGLHLLHVPVVPQATQQQPQPAPTTKHGQELLSH